MVSAQILRENVLFPDLFCMACGCVVISLASGFGWDPWHNQSHLAAETVELRSCPLLFQRTWCVHVWVASRGSGLSRIAEQPPWPSAALSS